MNKPENKKSCIFFYDETWYGTDHSFIDELAKSFKKIGYECVILDTRNKEKANAIDEFINLNNIHNFEFALSYDGFTLLIENNTKSILEHLGIKHFCFFADPPLIAFSASVYYATMAKKAYVSFLDSDHLQVFKNFFKAKSKCGFIPPGGFYSSSPQNSFSDRNIEVLYCATYVDFNAEYTFYKNKYNDSFMKFVDTIFSILIENTHKPLLCAVREACELINVSLDDCAYLKLCYDIRRIESCVKTMKIIEVLDAIANAGNKVTLYGANWEKSILSLNKNITILSSIPFREYINKMSDAKVSLNCLPERVDSVSERNFSAMLNGSVNATYETPYMKSMFTHGENILFYKHDALEKLGEDIRSVINNEEKYNHITSSAMAIAERDHTWDNRVSDILKIMND